MATTNPDTHVRRNWTDWLKEKPRNRIVAAVAGISLALTGCADPTTRVVATAVPASPSPESTTATPAATADTIDKYINLEEYPNKLLPFKSDPNHVPRDQYNIPEIPTLTGPESVATIIEKGDLDGKTVKEMAPGVEQFYTGKPYSIEEIEELASRIKGPWDVTDKEFRESAREYTAFLFAVIDANDGGAFLKSPETMAWLKAMDRAGNDKALAAAFLAPRLAVTGHNLVDLNEMIDNLVIDSYVRQVREIISDYEKGQLGAPNPTKKTPVTLLNLNPATFGVEGEKVRGEVDHRVSLKITGSGFVQVTSGSDNIVNGDLYWMKSRITRGLDDKVIAFDSEYIPRGSTGAQG